MSAGVAISKETQSHTEDLLRSLRRGEDALGKLFWQHLGYARADRRMTGEPLPEDVASALAEEPLLLATAGQEAGFRVIYVRFDRDRLDITVERAFVNQHLSAHPYALFIFSNRDGTAWHFVNVRSGTGGPERRTLRRTAVTKGDRLGTAAQRLTRIALDRIAEQEGPPAASLPPSEIQQAHDTAFDVEALTRDFYRRFVAVFQELRADLEAQSGDERWAHRYALLFLNRCMVVYFLQRTRWLGGATSFMRSFWKTYQEADPPRDTFVARWLRALFFDAFQGSTVNGRSFPSSVEEMLREVPALGEGPFRRGSLDEQQERYGAVISDERFRHIFHFLECFNFTIAEDRPLDQHLAVDPEMIGKVYESLVNVSGDADERGAAGIFYTPRTEIDLMCRLALVEYLARHLGDAEKERLYEVIFALELSEKRRADRRLASEQWKRIRALLIQVKAVDPACGAGSFLMGMLQVLDDLLRRADRRLGRETAALERRKQIIARSLYGVDVKDWAASIAELRLWLSLVVQFDDAGDKRTRPLLPEVSFNIRSGDALVQEVGGLDLGLHIRKRSSVEDPDRRSSVSTASSSDERGRLRERLEERRDELQEEIGQLLRQIEQAARPQLRLSGEAMSPPERVRRKTEGWRKEKKAKEAQAAQAEQALQVLRAGAEVPFVWELAFPEVFSGERSGFDIVIGNPPYVRQENIADPRRADEEVSRASKKQYKARLARTVYQAFPDFFEYDSQRDAAAIEIDKKSDLYIYFYFLSLRLLNEKGTLCFIASNSWLDVGYGRQLQEFVLRQAPIRFVIDNQSLRSFEDADVNTAITVFSAPDEHVNGALDHVARFVMLKVPFSQTLRSACWVKAGRQATRYGDAICRVFPIRHGALLEQGPLVPRNEHAAEEEAARPRKGHYDGQKWGGKYLRAPNIFWDVLEQYESQLVRLGDVAEVRFGIKTGANAFFFLDAQDCAEWGIEERFLVPALKNSRDARRIVVESEGFPLQLFLCNEPREALQGTAALRYIEAAEAEGLHERPTLASRARWWDLGRVEPAPLACNYQIGRVQHFFTAEKGLLASNNFLFIYAGADPFALSAALNSSWTQLWTNVMGRANFGGGLLKIETYETADIMTIDPALICSDEAQQILERADLFSLGSAARRELDELVFASAGFSSAEREAVMEALRELVRLRHAKSKSL